MSFLKPPNSQKGRESNSFYRCVSTQCVVAVPESTVCRTVNQVAKIIASKMKTYVKLPNIEEQNQIASRIFDQYGFPGIFHVVLNDVFLQKLIIICIQVLLVLLMEHKSKFQNLILKEILIVFDLVYMFQIRQF